MGNTKPLSPIARDWAESQLERERLAGAQR